MKATGRMAAGDAVPCELSEDETGIVPTVEWCHRTDKLVGTCGPLDKEHKCDHNHKVECGGGEEAYEKMKNGITKTVHGTYARAIMVNSLCEGLPALTVFVQCT